MKQKSVLITVLPWAVFFVPVVWFALLAGQSCGESVGLSEWMTTMKLAMATPFSIRITAYTGKALLFALAAYGFMIALYYAGRGNRRPGEEHGSAKLGNARLTCRHFRTLKGDRYIIFTKKVSISMNVWALVRAYQTNHNVLVIGGSGSGKTRFYLKPNVMQADCSYVICDPKGETYRALGGLLEAKGYEITIINLLNMQESDCYNPMRYIRNDVDAMKLVTNLIKNTTPKGTQQSDPFWESATCS